MMRDLLQFCTMSVTCSFHDFACTIQNNVFLSMDAMLPWKYIHKVIFTTMLLQQHLIFRNRLSQTKIPHRHKSFVIYKISLISAAARY